MKDQDQKLEPWLEQTWGLEKGFVGLSPCQGCVCLLMVNLSFNWNCIGSTDQIFHIAVHSALHWLSKLSWILTMHQTLCPVIRSQQDTALALRVHGQGGLILETQSPTYEGLTIHSVLFLPHQSQLNETKVPFFLETFRFRKWQTLQLQLLIMLRTTLLPRDL